MVSTARQKMPGLRPYAVALDDEQPIVTVIMSPSMAPRPNQFRMLIFDQHTGQLLSSGQPGNTPMSWLLRLHSQLFVGLIGELFMGTMALCFISALVSAY